LGSILLRSKITSRAAVGLDSRPPFGPSRQYR
jgi:hypothetical protein